MTTVSTLYLFQYHYVSKLSVFEYDNFSVDELVMAFTIHGLDKLLSSSSKTQFVSWFSVLALALSGFVLSTESTIAHFMPTLVWPKSLSDHSISYRTKAVSYKANFVRIGCVMTKFYNNEPSKLDEISNLCTKRKHACVNTWKLFNHNAVYLGSSVDHYGSCKDRVETRELCVPIGSNQVFHHFYIILYLLIHL